MINLMPPDLQKSYVYAHRNVRLVRWVIIFGLSLIGLVALSTSGVIYIKQAADNYNGQIASLQKSLESQNIEKVHQQVQDMGNTLKLSVQVLSKEVLFSKLLKQLGTVTPDKVSLTNLSINQDETAVNITAQTADYNSATQLQVNLSAPGNKIFDRADIVNISCVSKTDPGANAAYPCNVSIRALFAKNNPFLFISNTGSKT